MLAANFNQTGRTWSQGDFNYDGNVDLTDFTLLASNFNWLISLSAPATLSRVSAASVAPLNKQDLILGVVSEE